MAATITALGVRRLRKRLQLTQRQFAQALGTRQATVWRWEAGRAKALSVFVWKMRALHAQRFGKLLGEKTA